MQVECYFLGSWILNRAILVLTIFIEKNNNIYDINGHHIMKYIFITYLFDVVDVNTVFYTLCQA
jgi:hypothetical protein